MAYGQCSARGLRLGEDNETTTEGKHIITPGEDGNETVFSTKSVVVDPQKHTIPTMTKENLCVRTDGIIADRTTCSNDADSLPESKTYCNFMVVEPVCHHPCGPGGV